MSNTEVIGRTRTRYIVLNTDDGTIFSDSLHWLNIKDFPTHNGYLGILKATFGVHVCVHNNVLYSVFAKDVSQSVQIDLSGVCDSVHEHFDCNSEYITIKLNNKALNSLKGYRHRIDFNLDLSLADDITAFYFYGKLNDIVRIKDLNLDRYNAVKSLEKNNFNSMTPEQYNYMLSYLRYVVINTPHYRIRSNLARFDYNTANDRTLLEGYSYSHRDRKRKLINFYNKYKTLEGLRDVLVLKVSKANRS